MDGIFATTIVSGSRKSSSEYGTVTTVSPYSSVWATKQQNKTWIFSCCDIATLRQFVSLIWRHGGAAPRVWRQSTVVCDFTLGPDPRVHVPENGHTAKLTTSSDSSTVQMFKCSKSIFHWYQ